MAAIVTIHAGYFGGQKYAGQADLAGSGFRAHAAHRPLFGTTEMWTRFFRLGLCIAVVMPAYAIAQSYDRAEIAFFRVLKREHNDLARYSYLTRLMPHLSDAEQIVAGQMLASAESELGLYDEAVLAFPLKSVALPDLPVPNIAQWQARSALDAITELAKSRRIVMINEAHHNAQTRELTLALLPRLRALGFTYFAAEALGDDDPGLTQRGYPIDKSGTEYLHEPLYGEIVRTAIRLGYIIVPYDSSESEAQARETGQANNLYQRIFKKDPTAKLFVHCGYAHLDKAKNRLGDTEPMAMRLQALTGIEPLSVDQTQFLEVITDKTDIYHQITAAFEPKIPVVLVNTTTGAAWSAQPALYDVNVILPVSLSLPSLGDEAKIMGQFPHYSDDLSTIDESMLRPGWLSLGGERIAYPIGASLCRGYVPCVIEAHYADESDDATSADRYVFTNLIAQSKLFLRPGNYRLRALDVKGRRLSEAAIQIAAR
jgi:hypothetical protein